MRYDKVFDVRDEIAENAPGWIFNYASPAQHRKIELTYGALTNISVQRIETPRETRDFGVP